MISDYRNVVKHTKKTPKPFYVKYCRIDGNTTGELRDSQMDDFNAEGSSKFLFLLSTRGKKNLLIYDFLLWFDAC